MIFIKFGVKSRGVDVVSVDRVGEVFIKDVINIFCYVYIFVIFYIIIENEVSVIFGKFVIVVLEKLVGNSNI